MKVFVNPQMINHPCFDKRMPLMLMVGLACLVISPRNAGGQTDFNLTIRPILARHCTACHGTDEATREADLRLDNFDGATKDLGGYAAIVPGDPDSSELMERVTSDDDPMPPDGHARLTEDEIETLRRWIADGASYEKHWAFELPVPVDPVVDPDDAWSTSAIDRFVWQRLREKDLEPNEQAEPARLIRRLALDLTGLPPSQAQVDAFAADPSLQNYESIVDQLLADSAFGEHWASLWLDLARYADSVGYAGDERRTIWPWRDWLIRSLNENQPFDQFTIEVLAGDLLPEPTESQRLATAFHRNTLSNNEGGTNDEEFRTIAIKDRSSTTASTWLGLTMRCAECHSHKYDPISQVEYYQFLDFFNQTADADRPDETPVLKLESVTNEKGEPVSVPVLEAVASDQARTMHVMKRGNFRNTGEAVTAATPAFLNDWPEDLSKDRLGLAKWILSPENPLTARVIVNRYWSRIFGRGIVETEEDFGTQGTLPTHRELLDWLAIDFRESGWDTKRLLKMLVMSTAYRQSSDATPEKIAADPDNRWLSRGPRNRLSAEVVRDQALTISGLLSRKMYGPPVYPPNPIKSVTNAFKGAEVWTVSEGEDRYRRALYTYLKRSQPHPLFETFDMSTRDVCCLRRIETNTPLQSFMTLNDETFVEAAQALATLMMSGENIDAQIAIGLRRATFRQPDEADIVALRKLFEGSVKDFETDIEAARMMAGSLAAEKNDAEAVRMAALSVVGNVILNMDAVLTK